MYAVNQPSKVWSDRLYVSEVACDELAFWQQILQRSMVVLYGSHLLEWHTLIPVVQGMAAMLIMKLKAVIDRHSHADNPLIAH